MSNVIRLTTAYTPLRILGDDVQLQARKWEETTFFFLKFWVNHPFKVIRERSNSSSCLKSPTPVNINFWQPISYQVQQTPHKHWLPAHEEPHGNHGYSDRSTTQTDSHTPRERHTPPSASHTHWCLLKHTDGPLRSDSDEHVFLVRSWLHNMLI